MVDGCPPSSPVLSPDGRWVAYVVAPVGRTGEDPTSRLWVAAADGSVPPRRLDLPPAHVSCPRWAPDSDSLFFLSDHGAPGAAQLHRVGRTGGAPEELTGLRGGIDGYRPLVDPAAVAVIAADEPAEPADPADAWVRGRPRLSRLRLLDPRTGGTRDLGPPADAHSPAWWRGERWHLAYLALTPPGLHGGTAVFDLEVPDTGPAGAHRNLTAGLPACPAELVQVDRGAPLVLVADGLDTAIHRLGPDGPVELSRIRGRAEGLSADRGGDVVAAVVSAADQPHDVHAGPVGGPLTRRSDTRPELRGIRRGAQQRLSCAASTSSTPSACSNRPSAGPPRNCAHPRLLTVGPGCCWPPAPSSALPAISRSICATPGRNAAQPTG